MHNLEQYFSLEPEIHFLNHGSFGATPKPVLDVYQEWQRRLERQPVRFLGREIAAHLRTAREALGTYLHADAGDLVYIPNATHGVNIVARSLDLHPGDEVLTTDHEYGACDYTWEFICSKTGAVYVRQPVSLPAVSTQNLLEEIWQGVTPRTRLIFVSHITSPTALRLPVEAICARARQAGILTLIDGAHAPGQIPLDLDALGADFYTGNCHKWMMSPKGAGFLYTSRARQPLIEPLVVSWGYHVDTAFNSVSRYIDYLEWSGTHDPSVYLSVPAAIDFMQAQGWEQVRQQCHTLLTQTLQQLHTITGLPDLYPIDLNLFSQMGAFQMPPIHDPSELKNRLYDQYHVEIPVISWKDKILLRISVQGYNTVRDLDALVSAVSELCQKPS